MSNFTNPTHHVHHDNDPLPGAKGAVPTVDYTAQTMDHTRLPPSEEMDTQFQSKTGMTGMTGTGLNNDNNFGSGYSNTATAGHGHLAGQHNTHSPSSGFKGMPVGHDDTSATGMGYGKQGSHAGTMGNAQTSHPTSDSMGLNTASHKPTMGDKILGKTEELAGKVTRNTGMQEKGAARKQGELDQY